MRKNKSSFHLSLKSLGLGCSALAVLVIAPSFANNTAWGQEVAALNPTSGWNLKSDADKTSGYCALSRSFDDDVVLTLGRNQAEEYSLAIDFQRAKLDEDKAYPITLQPAPGQIRAYEMMPASARAIVVRLGYDDSFFKALEKSNLLKAEINKVKYNFQINDMGKGNAQLDTCLAKIKGTNNVEVAQNFKAEKIEAAEKTKLAEVQNNANPTPIVTTKAEPTNEIPKPIEIKKAAVEVKPAIAKPPKEITIKRVGQKEITSIEPSQPTVQNKLVDNKQDIKQNEKAVTVANATSTNTQPKVAVKAEAPKTVAKPSQVEIQKIAPVTTQKQSIVAAQPKLQRPTEIARNNRLSGNQSVSPTLNVANQNVLAVPSPEIVESDSAQLKPAVPIKTQAANTETQTALNNTNQTNYEAPITPNMLNAPKPFSSTVSAPQKVEVVTANDTDQKVEQKKAVIEAEAKAINQKQQKLAKAVEEQEQKLELLDEKDSKNEVVINNIREEIAILRIENRKLIEDAQKARAQLDSVAVESGTQAMKRIREYERKLEAAQADNRTLARQMDEMQNLKAQGRLDTVNGDVDLTQTTLRYNEAEREINRLGLLLEQQRAAHNSEKRELEQMLFDPAVTNEQQRKKLSQLEDRLKASEAQYARAQSELAKRAAIKPEVIIKPDPKTEAERQRLANEKVKLEQELSASQEKYSQELKVAQQQLEQSKLSLEQKSRIEEEKQSLANEKVKLEQELSASQQKYAQELKVAQQQLQQSQIALQQKPKTEIVIKPDPKVEAEKQRLAAEKVQLQIELQTLQSQLNQTQIALKKQEERKPPVAMADPLVQRNNIQIEQLNKKLSLQNQQLETYQRKIELEKQEQETLKQEQARLRQEQELLKQQATIATQKAEQAANQAKMAQQSMVQSKQEAQAETQKLRLEQQRIQNTLQQERAKIQQEQAKLALLEQEKLKAQAQQRQQLKTQQDQAARNAALAQAQQQQAQQQAAIMAQQEQAAKLEAQKRAFNARKIESILSQSGLFPNAGVRQTSSNEFRWNIGNVNGKAKVAEISQTPNMNSFVQGYIANAKQSCQGDFASLPSQTGQPNNYEIACVGGAQNRSSSLLFTQRDNHYIAIVHETTADDMDLAMDARDRIAEKL